MRGRPESAADGRRPETSNALFVGAPPALRRPRRDLNAHNGALIATLRG